MRRRVDARWAAAACALALALPVIAQESPESLLPPGFGSPEPAAPAAGAAQPARPATVQPTPGSAILPPLGQPLPAATDPLADANLSEEELAAQKAKYDLPEGARGSLDRIGPLTPETRGLDARAFGGQSGNYLMALMRHTNAPIVSRWTSILLRRALLSSTDTPGDVDGADWTAERAWLLLRMGEADSARLLVQSVDADRFTPRLYAIAMQTYLATADPAGLCPLSAGALRFSKEPGWDMTRAICPALSGDQGTASAVLNQAQRRGVVRGVDYRLAEKVVGTGFNARRSVKIEWDGVDRLTAWRFGLATALNVDIPQALYATAGQHVRAWEARAPALAPFRRLAGAEVAARLGIFSGDALLSFYSQLRSDGNAPDDAIGRLDALRNAYTGSTIGDRITAMRTLWGQGDRPAYIGLLATARAAAALPVARAEGQDAANLIAAMLSTGRDRNAANWARALGDEGGPGASEGWALLAVGAPSPVVEISSDRITAYADASDPTRGAMLVAALAGLARLPGADTGPLAQQFGIVLTPDSRWSRAIAAAAERRERGTVALLAAVGMQGSDWRSLPPAHLYHVVAALHRVGLDPEARMIAAEALTRS
ncbi:MAG: hypothetical protein ABW039_00350 [Sphingobium sp.]